MANYTNVATVTCNVTASPGATVYTVTLPTTDTYTIQGTLQLRNQDTAMSAYGAGGGAATGTGGATQIQSTVIAVVKQGATTIYTGSAGQRGFLTTINATAADVVTVNLYSSTSSDQQLNSVQATIAVSEGVI